MIEIRRLRPEDRARWDVLARGYKTFYRTELPDVAYAEAWARLMRDDALVGCGAQVEGQLVGISHHLFHANLWMGDTCYLQDLYVDECARGRGVARALIEHVAQSARERGSPRLYWLTHQDNARARALYDKVARFNGFVRYDYPLAPT
jgi:ribosomal protein S18 acetylase RimI-like enzyme